LSQHDDHVVHQIQQQHPEVDFILKEVLKAVIVEVLGLQHLLFQDVE